MDLTCSGPGPHTPENRVLGTGTTAVDGLLCEPCAVAAREQTSPPPVMTAGELLIDRYTVPADGSTYAVARYGSADTVLFVVDGTVQAVVPVAGVAELDIAARGPGPITVQIRDRSFVIVAEAV